jgi:hypothetical protein
MTRQPATAAGRALLEDNGPRVVTGEHDMLTRILAIEAEAAEPPAGAVLVTEEALARALPKALQLPFGTAEGDLNAAGWARSILAALRGEGA